MSVAVTIPPCGQRIREGQRTPLIDTAGNGARDDVGSFHPELRQSVKRIDRLVAEGERALSNEDRAPFYKKAQAILAEDLPAPDLDRADLGDRVRGGAAPRGLEVDDDEQDDDDHAALVQHNAEFDRWERMTDRERDLEIKAAGRRSS